jgi:hypothetical protein
VVQTNDDGSTFYTKNKARVFSAKGKKDFAYAMLFAFIRFLQWVNQYGEEESESVPAEDAEMCG